MLPYIVALPLCIPSTLHLPHTLCSATKLSNMKYASFLLLAIIVGLEIRLSFTSRTSKPGMGVSMGISITPVPALSNSNKLSGGNSAVLVTVASPTAANPPMASPRAAAVDEITNEIAPAGSGAAAPWSYEDKATLARPKRIDPSQTHVMIPAQNGFGYQQQPAIPNPSSSDNTNASISIKILRTGGPIGLLIMLINLIYWSFFQNNNCPCREVSTAGETNFKCDISMSCSG